MVRTQSAPSAFPFLSESSSPDVCLSFCAALPSSHTRRAPPRSLSPLPTGREALQPGFSGPSSWLQATFKEWGLSRHLLPPLPPVPPFSFLSGPLQVQPLSLPHLIPTPTVLTRWTNQRAWGQRQAQSRLTGGGLVPDRQTDMQQAN